MRVKICVDGEKPIYLPMVGYQKVSVEFDLEDRTPYDMLNYTIGITGQYNEKSEFIKNVLTLEVAAEPIKA